MSRPLLPWLTNISSSPHTSAPAGSRAMPDMASSLPNRQLPASRAHSHSVSLGTLNSSHRVNRRKSSASITPNAMAAFAAAAVKEAGPDPTRQARTSGQVEGLGIMAEGGNLVPSNQAEVRKSPNLSAQPGSGPNGSVLVDGPLLSSMSSTNPKGSTKGRARRASEGSRIVKERTRSNAGELKCETCGKGYKHGSCLTKHLWEHTPEWALTSKLLISKHQQVQLLEAASVLVSMNSEGSPAIKPFDHGDNSDLSSQSPAASGSSGAIVDDDSSSRTSTPSQDENESPKGTPFVRHQPRRQDSYSSNVSRSYQSTSGTSFGPSSGPTESGLPFYSQWNSSSRPSTAPGLTTTEEQADITAAAEGLLSCSLGTPQTLPVQAGSDIPPVPPLPARFAKLYGDSPRLYPQYTGDVEMSDEERRRGEDEDEGVFGRMDQ